MQRAMAKEAEAERERRAKIVAAEGEYQAAVKLGQAADIITEHPVALQLRTLQTIAPHPPDDGGNLGRKEFDHHFPRTIYDDRAGSRPAIVEGFSIKIAWEQVREHVTIQAAAIKDRDQARALLSPRFSYGPRTPAIQCATSNFMTFAADSSTTRSDAAGGLDAVLQQFDVCVLVATVVRFSGQAVLRHTGQRLNVDWGSDSSATSVFLR